MEKGKGQKIYKIIMLIMIVIVITSLTTAYGTYKYLNDKGIANKR